jgi:curved DNA-binding protein CbpA
MKDFREQNFYELLDLKPHAASQEVESCYQRARRFLSPDSVATYALFQPEELALLRQRIEEAFRVLSDSDRRKSYDAEMLQAGVGTAGGTAAGTEAPRVPESAPEPRVEPASQPPTPATGEAPRQAPAPADGAPSPATTSPQAPPPVPACTEPPKPAMPEITQETEFTGELLRQIRLARGLSLEKVAETTKINMFYLRGIEGESVKDLPAEVYVRGYLRMLAGLFRLDPRRVIDSFMKRIGPLGD